MIRVRAVVENTPLPAKALAEAFGKRVYPCPAGTVLEF